MGWWETLTQRIFRNSGGRFSGRYRDRGSFYSETYQWLADVPDLSTLDDPYAKSEDQYLSEYDKYRLQLYKFNRALYQGDHYNAFRFAQYLYRSGMLDDDLRLSEIFGDGGTDVLFIAVNLFQLITDTFADLITEALGPIRTADGSDNGEAAIRRIVKNSDLKQLLHRSIITGSYKGDIILTVHGRSATAGNDASSDGPKVYIRGRRADTWFPTIDPKDRMKFIEHCFMSQIKANDKFYILRERYADDGIYHDVKELKGNKLIEDAPAEIYEKYFGDTLPHQEYPADLSMDDMVIHIPNKVSDDNDPYGDSDYNRAVLTLADELNHRLTQLGHQLDKHGDLGMSGPELGGEEVENPNDDNPVNRGAAGKYISREPDDAEPKYIVMPTEHFNTIISEIEMVIEELCRETRMSPRLIGLKKGAAEEAFDTLRLACVNTLLRNRSRIIYIDPGLIKAIMSAIALEKIYEVEGALDEVPEIRTKWGDGFPIDAEKLARTWQIRTGSKQTASQKQAIIDMDGLEGAQETLDEINSEESTMMKNLPGLQAGRKPQVNLEAGEAEATGQKVIVPPGPTPRKQPEINAGGEEPGSRTQSR